MSYICRDCSTLCTEHMVFTKRIHGTLGLQQSGNISQSDHVAPPTTPPTATPLGATEHTSTSETGNNFDDTDRDNSGLRRSSRKRVQRVMDYGESSCSLTSQPSDVIKKKKHNKKITTFSTSHYRRKRRRIRQSRESGAESDGPQAKKVCCDRANASSEEEKEENMVVDLAPLSLGVKFRDEMDTLNKEEAELVSL